MPIPLLYDPRHQLHAPPVEFDQARHIQPYEAPARVEGIRNHLLACRLGVTVPVADLPTISDLMTVHSPEYLDFLQAAATFAQSQQAYLYPETFTIRPQMAAKPQAMLGCAGRFAADVYAPIGAHTWQAASAAAGLALQGATLLLAGGATCAYALCRPPGHHAGPDFYGGYCYLNNAALAARRLAAQGQVAILDIDYHHGNGTQAIFWDDPLIFTTSLHITPELHYPYYTGYEQEIGGKGARHTNRNIPLPETTTAEVYLTALDDLLASIRAFDPWALVVSVGYDTYHADPLSPFCLRAEDYAAIGARLRALNLPLLLVQEGGYATADLPELAEKLISELI